MNYGNYEKIKKIRKTETVLKKIHEGIKMYCSNKECNNTVKLNEDESSRTILCTKCNSGVFVLNNPKLLDKANNEEKKKVNKKIHKKKSH